MSAQTIARWKAISMERTEPSETALPSTNKRPRSPNQDDSDDDISLLSRSPSPRAENLAIEVAAYDELVKGVAREVIDIHTKIKETNKGFMLLAKLGWSAGQPLGLSPDARVDPIPFAMKADSTGLGKVSQDVRMIETTVAQRRVLDSERQRMESIEQKTFREAQAAQKAMLQTQISSTLKPFYCELCDKQFNNVVQYDEHTNSYAHAHKARAKDMQASLKLKGTAAASELDKRREKEKKREEKELRKIAKAAGVKLIGTSNALNKPPVLAAPSPAEPLNTGFKKSGWAAVSTTIPADSPPPRSPSLPPPPPAETPAPPPYDAVEAPRAMNFRSSGWSSLGDATTERPGDRPAEPQYREVIEHARPSPSHHRRGDIPRSYAYDDRDARQRDRYPERRPQSPPVPFTSHYDSRGGYPYHNPQRTGNPYNYRHPSYNREDGRRDYDDHERLDSSVRSRRW
ncbi:hypothetical protein SISSUDRAFT_1049660 [Sistotremastrum suecicum HHB10207 ss-3]|uniref:G-patch domain-containing protein n=1 Tax=Sistotremastrum suecicum HHB10207 ss-3 TaxID=1314776 RepID=A0A166BPZ3_9AGAM|nr:hypothetical protein SISSUDRAFT_1049660 [Sistotremastrum suecicum HHB10207 ss-3]